MSILMSSKKNKFKKLKRVLENSYNNKSKAIVKYLISLQKSLEVSYTIFYY